MVNSDSGRSQNQSVGSGMSMRLKKVCPQCSAVLHASKLACQCGHVFRAKPQQNERKRLIESRETDNVRKVAKRACETQEEALNRQAQNAEHMASVRESETRGKSVKRQAQNKQHMASVRACATGEETLKRQAQNKQHMASVRASETSEQALHRQQSNKQTMSSTRKRNVSVECAQTTNMSVITDPYNCHTLVSHSCIHLNHSNLHRPQISL